jgi:hypothetical protein
MRISDNGRVARHCSAFRRPCCHLGEGMPLARLSVIALATATAFLVAHPTRASIVTATITGVVNDPQAEFTEVVTG